MDVFKFPRTKHLFDAGGSAVSRDDLLMDQGEEATFYSKKGKGGRVGRAGPTKAGHAPTLVAMEEKVDGANLGISVNPDTFEFKVQNRSHYVNSKTHRQFSTLDSWLSEHSEGLFKVLGSEPGRYVLFGEWVYATHSIAYTRLPDYFLAFDIYDCKGGKFLSWRERNRRLEGTGIHTVRLIAEEQVYGRDDVRKWLDTDSAFYDGPVEGVYLPLLPIPRPLPHRKTRPLTAFTEGKWSDLIFYKA